MKKHIGPILVAAVAAIFASQPVSASGQKESQKKLVISTWGLSEDALWSEVYEPFEKKYNVKIVLDTGNGQERYTKMTSDPNSSIDIIELAQKNTADGVDASVFTPINPSDIQEFDKLIPAAQSIIKSGSGVPYTLNSIGIIYNPAATGMEIKTWADLWNPTLKGKIAIPDITTTFGPAILAMASDVKGVDIKDDGGETAFKALEELKPNVVRTYAKSSDVANFLRNGEITVAVIGDFGVPVVSKADPDAKYVVPESGTYANFNVINITKNTKNRELALAYINYRLSAETEIRTAKALNEAPVNSGVKLAPEVAKYMTTGTVAAHAKVIDFSYVLPHLAAWIDRYNRLMNQ